jgi:hypothetical protein
MVTGRGVMEDLVSTEYPYEVPVRAQVRYVARLVIWAVTWTDDLVGLRLRLRRGKCHLTGFGE